MLGFLTTPCASVLTSMMVKAAMATWPRNLAANADFVAVPEGMTRL